MIHLVSIRMYHIYRANLSYFVNRNAKSGGCFSESISFTRRPLEEEESVQGDKTEMKRKKPPRSTVKLTLLFACPENVQNQSFRGTRCNSSFRFSFLFLFLTHLSLIRSRPVWPKMIRSPLMNNIRARFLTLSLFLLLFSYSFLFFFLF